MNVPPGSRRSPGWFGARGRSGMVYRSWMRSQGFGPRCPVHTPA
jgi:hypothetical protein